MKDLSDIIKESLSVDDIIHDVKESIHHAQDKKEMMAYLNAITNGLQEALDLRKDPGYMPRNRKKFDEANELLESFIEHIQNFA